MKKLHQPNLYGWSNFDEERNIDFNSVLWVREKGNVLVDPLPLSSHDQDHLEKLGGAAWIVITNSDHVRDAQGIAEKTGAAIVGPAAEKESFPFSCSSYLSEGDELVPGLIAIELYGSKTPGELALILNDTTLITGDLIRAHQGGSLCILPDAKLTDRQKAIASVQRVAELPRLEAVLPGDGWPVFREAKVVLQQLLTTLKTE